MADKVQQWERRGRRPLTVQEVEEILSRNPFLPVPKELIILDGVIEPESGQIAVGATPTGYSTMILTPLSDEGTIIHESIHEMGLGEVAAYSMTPILTARGRLNMGLMRRQIEFQPAGTLSETELREKLRLSPEIYHEIQVFYRLQQTRALPSELKRYRLVT